MSIARFLRTAPPDSPLRRVVKRPLSPALCLSPCLRPSWRTEERISELKNPGEDHAFCAFFRQRGVHGENSFLWPFCCVCANENVPWMGAQRAARPVRGDWRFEGF